MTRRFAVTQEITLGRVQMHSVEVIAADALGMMRRLEPRRMDAQDAIEVRRMIEGWGRTSRIDLRCPANWWQHLKLTIRTRWPRLFGRLAVSFDHAIAENGAIVAELGRVMADKRVIPYAAPVFERSYVDDPTVEDEP